MTSRFYEFGPFRIDAQKRRLLRGDEALSLTPKAFETLLALVQNSGVVLDKDDLMRMIWPDTAVEEANLTQNVSVLRKVLGESSADRQYIVTVPGRGYRFVADVIEAGDTSSDLIVERRTRSRLVIEDVSESASQAEAICVLPFRSLGAGGDDYLGLGIADALITRLGNVSRIIVRPTSAILKYVGSSHSPLLAGRDLGVESVLEGSIRRDRDRLRVTAQLVSVRDEAPLWAGKFDELFTDIFTVEDRISEQITRALTLKLTGEEHRRLVKHHTESAEAYQAYLKGLYFASRATAESCLRAIEYLGRAIELDADYALAYACLADSYTWLSHLYMRPQEAMLKAKEAALKALEIDCDLGEAHYALALVKMYHDWDWAGAEARFKRAIGLNPNHAMAHTLYSFYLTAMGRFDEAEAENRLAERIDPLSLLGYTMCGWSLYFSRDFDGAIERFKAATELDASFHNARWGLGWAYIWKGSFDESVENFEKAMTISGGGAEIIAGLAHAKARSGSQAEALGLLAELEELASHRYVPPFYLALVYAGLGDKDKAFEFLDRACDERFEWMLQFKVDPVWDFLRSDARYPDLLRRIGHL
jgi:DNA-binding winged helix-turn-helix (wHTH) protein/tetratricopeptide (TPR) repeat protein